jgi:hypothetical protein
MSAATAVGSLARGPAALSKKSLASLVVLRIVVAAQESARHRGFRHKGSVRESTLAATLEKSRVLIGFCTLSALLVADWATIWVAFLAVACPSQKAIVHSRIGCECRFSKIKNLMGFLQPQSIAFRWLERYSF